jgi:hypothetical protein
VTSPLTVVGLIAFIGLIFYAFWMLDRRNIEVDHNPFVVTANYDEIKRFFCIKVQLLMWHIRCEVNEITGTHLCCKLEPLSPTYLTTPFYDIDSNLVTPMVMRPSLCMGLKGDCADPGFSSPNTGKIKCGCTSSTGRSKHDSIEQLGSHNLYAVGSPLYRFRHVNPTIG